MRVLALAPYPDTAPSTRYRVAQFVPALRDLGVELTLHPFVDDAGHRSVRRGRAGALRAVAGAVVRLRRVLAGVGEYDAVLVQRGLAGVADGPFLRILERSGAPFVYDFDDAVHLPQEGGRGWVERLRTPEATTASFCAGARRVLAGNDHLAAFARRYAGRGRVQVLPSVVDTVRFRPAERHAPGPPVLGWVGSASTLPYLESLAPALAVLADRIPHRLVVVGGPQAPRLDGVRFDYVVWRPEDEVRYFQEIDVGLYPLADTPWTRGKCGFKALQYMACGAPCVASPVGVLERIVRPGRTGLHAEGPDAWVEACVRLLGDPGLRRSLGRAGRALVEERYSVAAAAPVLAGVLRDAAGPS